jgi:hypothetical protein
VSPHISPETIQTYVLSRLWTKRHFKYIENFGEQVPPLVRKLEKEGRGNNSEDEIVKTGDVSRVKVSEKKADEKR